MLTNFANKIVNSKLEKKMLILRGELEKRAYNFFQLKLRKTGTVKLRNYCMANSRTIRVNKFCQQTFKFGNG